MNYALVNSFSFSCTFSWKYFRIQAWNHQVERSLEGIKHSSVTFRNTRDWQTQGKESNLQIKWKIPSAWKCVYSSPTFQSKTVFMPGYRNIFQEENNHQPGKWGEGQWPQQNVWKLEAQKLHYQSTREYTWPLGPSIHSDYRGNLEDIVSYNMPYKLQQISTMCHTSSYHTSRIGGDK